MSEQERVARAFEDERTRLRAIAGRMLGSTSEADDVVQETWLRLSRSNPDEIENLPGWLTTVASRICLDHLRARNARREHSIDVDPERPLEIVSDDDPEGDVLQADAIGSALRVVLDRLSPPERVAFVLHDSFGVPFEEIAPIIGRSTVATRQLASRARRKVSGGDMDVVDASSGDLAVIDAFLAASRNGDMVALLNVLAPDVAVHADATAASFGVDAVTEGNESVARFFNGRAAAAFLATINGRVAAVWMMHGAPRVAFEFTIVDGSIERIDLVGDPARLEAMEYELLPDHRRNS